MAVIESPVSEITSRATPYLDHRTKILYGTGEIANSIKMVVFALFTLYFYTTVMGLPGTLVGIASAIVLVWDAVINPYVGYLSDKARFRFGRRHTFMLAGTTSMGISLWAFLSPPQGLSTGLLFAWLLGSSLLVRTTTSVFAVPYFALGAELSQDYHERTSITAIRGLWALLGTLATAALSFVIFFPDAVPGVDPKLNYAGYPAMGLTFGLVMSLVGLVATAGTLPWRSYLPNSRNDDTTDTPWGFLASFTQSMRNPSFRVIFLSVSFFFLGVVINTTLSIHYLTYYVKITASAALSGFQLAFYLGGLVGVVFWLWISKRTEKHWLYLLGALVTGILMLAAYLLLGEGHLLGTGDVRPLIIGNALAGFFGSSLWFLPASMIADVADEDELDTGHRREGSFFGIFFFGQRLAAGMSSIVAGVLVDSFAGLIPGQVQQSAMTIQRIGMLYSVLPAVLVVVAGALTFRYTLSRSRVRAIQAELESRRRAL
jgi:GPH family glycoside/pentoside/hexuronide:cation symporter